MLSVKTKRVYDPPSQEDGFRLLIMRRWPRGIPKGAVDAWEKELGPSLPLLAEFRSGPDFIGGWDEYKKRYLEEVSQKTRLLDWVKTKASQGTVTLLCGCQDESRCHRSLLKALLLSQNRLRDEAV